MITVGMNYNVIPGKQREFEDKFEAVIGAIRSAPGHVHSSLYRDVKDDTAYLIVSEWSEQGGFTEFIRSQAFKDVTAWGKAEILSGRPRHTVYRPEPADPGQAHRRGSTMLSALLMTALLALIVIPFTLRPETPGGSGEAPSLIIISPHNEQIRHEFAEAFGAWHQEHYGEPVWIDFRRPGGTSEIRAQLIAIYESAIKRGHILPDGSIADGGAMPYDLCFGGGTYEHGRLKQGVSVRLDGETIDMPISIPAGFAQSQLDEWFGENKLGVLNVYDPDQHWLGLAASSFGILYNLDSIHRYDLPEPSSWTDLTDPRYAGLVALGDPRQSGSIATTYESILNSYGWEEGWRILRALCANARYFAAESKKVVLDISHGDAAAGVSIDFYGRYQAQAVIPPGGAAEDSRLRFVEPAARVFVDPDPISLMRGAPHPELARRFIEFCLTDEGQALWQLPARTKAAVDPGIGPRKYELRRMPIRRGVYETLGGRFIDDINPYEIASDATPRGWRSMIGPMMGAFGIDVHHECSHAWRLIDKARNTGADPSAIAELEDLFFAMPTHVTEDGRALVFSEANYSEIRNEWRDRDRASELRIQYSGEMMRNYNEIIRRAERLIAGSEKRQTRKTLPRLLPNSEVASDRHTASSSIAQTPVAQARTVPSFRRSVSM
jgi:ABC-type Fe3+ transport system substrate-binding protein/heme-degrading monooxygenase HmoA